MAKNSIPEYEQLGPALKQSIYERVRYLIDHDYIPKDSDIDEVGKKMYDAKVKEIKERRPAKDSSNM